MRTAALLAAALALAAPVAEAAWSPGATGHGSARAHVMPGGPTPAPVLVAVGTVSLTWSASSFDGGPPAAGYVVRRVNVLTGTSAAAGGTCAGVVAATSCTESGVPAGTWAYSVAAAQGLWRGAEGLPSPVAVL